MNASVFSLWRVRVLATALAIVGAGALSLMMVTTVSAAAPNGFTSQTYKDVTGDGAIDAVTVVINGGEALTACVVTDAEVTTDWTYVGGATFGGGLAVSGNTHSCVTGTATVTLQLLAATAGVTGGGTAPTIAYDNDDADNSIANASGNLGTVAAQNGADGAAPQIKSFTYQEASDFDGKIDQFTLTFTETVIAATSILEASHLSLTNVGDFTGAGWGSATTDVLVSDGTTVVMALGTEATVKDTAEGSGTIAISTITGDGTMTLKDATNNANTSVKAQVQATFADGAAPQISTVTYSDADSDAKVDTFLFTYTESTNAASVLKANELSLTGVGDFTALAFGSADVDFADGGTTDSLTLGTESSAQDTNEGAGTIAVSTTSAVNNNFSLTDGTNDNVTEKAEAQIAFVDLARPMLLTTSPANGATGVTTTASIVLTFSEAISGDATWTHTGGPETTSFTETGTNALTLAHSAYFSSGYHSIDVTVATDAASNLYNGAVAAIADPFTFTVTSSSTSTGSSSTTAATYDIDVTSPNGGEELTPGSTHDITWSSSSSTTSMAFVNINFSYTMDGSTYQETIVEGTANDSSYSWTVPDIDTDSASIQIVGTDLVEALATDSSDDYFTIGSPDTSSDDSDDEGTDEEVTAPSSGTTGMSPVTGEEEEISAVAYGDYIRSSYFDTVYYVDMDDNGDLVRRPFMDAQTFMTWQNDWDDVETVTDATLPTIALGNPMLPKAGVVLVKIQSDARVFAIEGDGTIRWITTEDVAIAIYGADWADYVIDVAATLFPRFTEGDDLDGVENTDTDAMKTRDQVNS